MELLQWSDPEPFSGNLATPSALCHDGLDELAFQLNGVGFWQDNIDLLGDVSHLTLDLQNLATALVTFFLPQWLSCRCQTHCQGQSWCRFHL